MGGDAGFHGRHASSESVEETAAVRFLPTVEAGGGVREALPEYERGVDELPPESRRPPERAHRRQRGGGVGDGGMEEDVASPRRRRRRRVGGGGSNHATLALESTEPSRFRGSLEGPNRIVFTGRFSDPLGRTEPSIYSGEVRGDGAGG
nr:unnamed protein product [Digitaria exilis]